MTVDQLLGLYGCGNLVSLASWLGDPCCRQEAEACALQMRSLARDHCSHAPVSINARLAELIARYWAGRDADMDYRTLAATVADSRDRAQLELCYGQLLIARRLARAWTHLDAGFAAAANFLLPDEYFEVLNRHQRLRALALGTDPAGGAGLDELLKEARIISQLRGKVSCFQPGSVRHEDTLD